MRFSKWFLAVAAVCGLAATGGVARAQFYPPYPTYPQYPVIQTQPHITGVTPWGGINTGGATIHNSAFDPYRELSKHTGPSWNVNRPVYQNGQVVGWETGKEWLNPYTGQVHGHTNQVTPNGLGGFNNQTNIRSANPNAGGVHRQTNIYGGRR